MTNQEKKPQKVRVDVTALDKAIQSAYRDGLRCAVAIQNEIERLTK